MRHAKAPLSVLTLLLVACPGDPAPGADPATPSAPSAATPTPSSPTAPTDPAGPPTPPAEPDPTPPTEPPAVSPTETPSPAPPTADDTKQFEVATGFNAFGLDLYRQLATEPGDQVISPASIAFALTMVEAGAHGDTATELRSALHYPRSAIDARAAVSSMLHDYGHLPASPRGEPIELAVANRLFGDAKVAYEAPFLALCERAFGAPLERVDFRTAHEAARVRINGWVEDQTHDRIVELLPSGAVDSTTRLALVNAVYFKAQWLHAFEEALTAPAPFHADGGTHDVPTMIQTERFSFSEHAADGVQVIELPYVDTRFAMTILLPTAKDGLAALERNLDAEHWDRWTSLMIGQEIELSMPKFRVAPAQSLQLKSQLAALGVREAFSSESDLTGIAPAREQLQLSEVFHKGFVEVDEKGTEAAAATAAVVMLGAAAPEAGPKRVKIDRPFVYAIRDTKTGLLLFLGRVVDPKTA